MAIGRKNHQSANKFSKKLVVILGPTAVGKSSLAVVLAKIFQGEIISADSRQVYRGMDIGTGKITPEETLGVPHHLLSIVSPRTRFDVAKYQKKAYQVIQAIHQRHHLPFLVGGSPLYLYSVIQGWQFSKAKADLALRKTLAQKSLAELLKTLQHLDPLYFQKVEKGNRRRVIRAIEIASQLGKVPPLKKRPLFETLLLGLKVPLPSLKTLIHQRLVKRFDQGMIKEVADLHQQGISWKRLEEFGLEYKWISYYLQNKLPFETMQTKLQQDIEKFAKRQMTWFKKDPNIHWVQNKKEAELLIKNFIKL